MTVSMMMPAGHNAALSVRSDAETVHEKRQGARVVTVLMTVLAMVLMWGAMSALYAEPAQSNVRSVPMVSYTVRPGDTLWSYASAITPAGEDVSDTVAELIEINNLESGVLEAGQRIVVPAQ
ncbi:peptidoglycan-binding protein LysM [Bifidobacterium sp. DSM 109957]|uniref:Peptidoglycan-binding protein LysM n=1 Tax=Bifidobacterium oedipodis TaxID=2675322 RepID=A0A7Y0HQI6_9BIFI|nr:peptidoglycan-binding protein LysM [Bifidobacterium sp. DSM 109957]